MEDYPETFEDYKRYRSDLKSSDDTTLPPPQKKEAPSIGMNDDAYASWLRDRSPANMTRLLDSLAPTINSEITRFEGPRPLLRSRARVLAIKAIKSYNPMSGAKLKSWVVTNLQPLSRYGQRQRDVRIPEVALRQAAAVNRVTQDLKDEFGRDPTDEEIADELGMSPKRVARVREMAVASVPTGRFDEMEGADGDTSISPGVVTPSRVPFAQDAVYMSLNDTDKLIFDMLTGSHGKKQVSGKAVAAKLGVTPASISQRASAIANQISEVANG